MDKERALSQANPNQMHNNPQGYKGNRGFK